MATTISPPSDFFNTSPQFGVDIYPHEITTGKPYSFSGSSNGVLSATITKSIRDRVGGSFILNIVPGGINGINDPITWTKLITPMSLAVIYMQRGKSKRIVMLGVVSKTEESELWTPNKGVQRAITIYGLDFTYYFSAFSYYEMLYFGLLQNTPTAGGVAGNLLGIFGGSLAGPPAKEARDWLTTVMLGINLPAGSAQAVMQNTYVNYNNSILYLNQLFGYWFEGFDELGSAGYMPLFMDLLTSEGSWVDKFAAMLTWPFYEFFVTTASTTDYPALVSNTTSGITASYTRVPPSTISVTGYDPVYPVVIGRVNPLPWVGIDTSTTTSSLNTPTAWQSTRWDNLTSYDYQTNGLIAERLTYTTDELGNFFAVSSTDSRALASSSGASPTTFGIEMIGAYLNQISIDNYGYRPKFIDTKWLTTINPSDAPGANSVQYIAEVLLGKISSYYTPTPFMLKGEATIPLWPDVTVGNKFLCYPFKNSTSDSNNQYTFYIESVRHHYTFGGPSFTVVDLTRGLRSVDYSNATLMQNLHLGKSAPINGILTDIPTNPSRVPKVDPGVSYVTSASITSLGLSPFGIPSKLFNGSK